ncbi:MAG: alpha/beta hydrolase family protein [Candidatus Magasanikbacteria bacterium]
MSIKSGSRKLPAYFKKSKIDHYILFLYGGGKDKGKEKFKLWQDKLAKEGIGSLSFDFSGMGDAPGQMKEESLESRISEARSAALWLRDEEPSAEFSLYGVSMGGYVALGLVDKMPEMFSSLILQAPAAYSQNAHNLPFDDSFTEELHEENSWKDSYSFKWLKEYEGRVLFVSMEKDNVIPEPILERYKDILDEKDCEFVTIPDAPHGIWGDTEEDAKFREIVYENFCEFLLGKDN